MVLEEETRRSMPSASERREWHCFLGCAAGIAHIRQNRVMEGRGIGRGPALLPFACIACERQTQTHADALGLLLPFVGVRQRHQRRALAWIAAPSADRLLWHEDGRSLLPHQGIKQGDRASGTRSASAEGVDEESYAACMHGARDTLTESLPVCFNGTGCTGHRVVVATT